MEEYLYNYDSEENSYLVDGYPWGFKLKTQVRYWVETKESKNGGQRYCKQTKDPRNGKWCKPKKSTYAPVIIMFLNEENHVKFTGIRAYLETSKIEEIELQHGDNFSEYQKKKLQWLKGLNKAMEGIEISFEPVIKKTHIIDFNR